MTVRRAHTSAKISSTLIAKGKAGTNSLQVPNMEEINPFGRRQSVHWSAHDVKVAYFQEAHTSRNVMQTMGIPNSPDVEDFFFALI